MNRFRYLSFVILAAALASSVSGQGKEISAVDFRQVEQNAERLLENLAYRLTESIEYFENKDGQGVITRAFLKEVVPPDRWRTVEEQVYDGKTTKDERIWNGKALFVRRNDGAWDKYSGGGSTRGRSESGTITNTYRLLGPASIDGVLLTLYEVEQHRRANKASRDSMVQVQYIRMTKYWFNNDGTLARRVEENEIKGRNEFSRETVIYSYDPNINIKTPIP